MTDPTLFDKFACPPSVLRKDPCERKHGGNPESVAAYSRETAAQQRERVLRAIRAAKGKGLTVDELSAAWGATPNSISGRFTELKAAGDIRKVGTRPTRSGKAAGVYVVTEG